jgi:hypothetical protein
LIFLLPAVIGEGFGFADKMGELRNFLAIWGFFSCRGVAFSGGTLYTESRSAMVPRTAVTIASVSELLFLFSIGG